MKAGARQLVLVAGLAAVLAVLVWAAVRLVARPEEQRARAAGDRSALPFQPGEATALVIAPRGAPARRLEGEAAEGLLRALARLEVRARLPADPSTLASRGLDPPVARVTVELRNGQALSLDLGDPNPFDGSRFGRRDGVLLVLDRMPGALLEAPGGPPAGQPAGRPGG